MYTYLYKIFYVKKISLILYTKFFADKTNLRYTQAMKLLKEYTSQLK